MTQRKISSFFGSKSKNAVNKTVSDKNQHLEYLKLKLCPLRKGKENVACQLKHLDSSVLLVKDGVSTDHVNPDKISCTNKTGGQVVSSEVDAASLAKCCDSHDVCTCTKKCESRAEAMERSIRKLKHAIADKKSSEIVEIIKYLLNRRSLTWKLFRLQKTLTVNFFVEH